MIPLVTLFAKSVEAMAEIAHKNNKQNEQYTYVLAHSCAVREMCKVELGVTLLIGNDAG